MGINTHKWWPLMATLNSNDPSTITIVGAGIAGLVCALELLKKGKKVTIIDGQSKEKVGGLAKDAFGGMALINTPLQTLNGIQDTADLAWQDWCNFAEFSEQDEWPKRWAKYYIQHSKSRVYDWVKSIGVNFLPVVNWVERGDYVPGNSVPRYHVMWGTSKRLVSQTLAAINKVDANLTWLCDSRVNDIQKNEQGFSLTLQQGTHQNQLHTHTLIVASGGINGNLKKARQHWHTQLSPAPKPLLNGAHPSADGHLHDTLTSLGANVTHLEWMWNYAAGIKHPEPEFEHKGLSLIPPKTALWLDAHGKRIGPQPMVSGFDTHNLCHRVAKLPHQYTWQIMNKKIAEKELAVSGADINPAIRDRKLFTFIKEILFGNKRLVKYLTDECEDVLVADTLDELVVKMNLHTPDVAVQLKDVKAALKGLDQQLAKGPKFHNDDQLRRLSHLRNWKGDKLRTCASQPIEDQKAGPLIAIKETIISRKSMGGMQTNLHSQLLDTQSKVMPNLYVVGEAAGFGGGGISGNRSLEGTFLAGCILTARAAADHLNQLQTSKESSWKKPVHG